MCKSYTSLVKFIPEYFILLEAIINAIVCLISFLDCSLLVYGNTIDFCIFILYLIPATFLLTLIYR